MRKILVIQGHPNKNSFCSSIALAYSEAAKGASNTVKVVDLADLKFDPILRFGFQTQQELEPDLSEMQKLISEADHIVWIYPNWWGGQPALLKGFIDRTFLPGFAFKYKSGLGFPEKLLINKTTEIILTLDTPVWFYRYVMGAPGLKVMKTGVLEFCGLKVTRTQFIGPIRDSAIEKRSQWLSQIRDSV